MTCSANYSFWSEMNGNLFLTMSNIRWVKLRTFICGNVKNCNPNLRELNVTQPKITMKINLTLPVINMRMAYIFVYI